MQNDPTIRVTFHGGKRVDSDFGRRSVKTERCVEHGGAARAPEPFEHFLTSLATCAGLYVLAFCQVRSISTAGVALVQSHRFDEATQRLARVEIEIILPATFPEKYRPAIERAAAGCKIRKTLLAPPEVVVSTRIEGASAQAPV